MAAATLTVEDIQELLSGSIRSLPANQVQIPNLVASSSTFTAVQIGTDSIRSVTVPLIPLFPSSAPDELPERVEFDELARAWKRDTDHISSITKTVMHPAYQTIIGMGPRALPYILRHLREHGGHWFWALRAITREDPAQGVAGFEMAMQAWLAWGYTHGYS